MHCTNPHGTCSNNHKTSSLLIALIFVLFMVTKGETTPTSTSTPFPPRGIYPNVTCFGQIRLSMESGD